MLTFYCCGLLSRVGNTGSPGVWLFHTGNRYSFDNVAPASVGGLLATPPPDGPGMSLVCSINFIKIQVNFVFSLKKKKNPTSSWLAGHYHPRVLWIWWVCRQHVWAADPGRRTRLPSYWWASWVQPCTFAQWPLRGPSSQPCSPHPLRGFWPSGSGQEWRRPFDLWTESQFWASS